MGLFWLFILRLGVLGLTVGAELCSVGLKDRKTIPDENFFGSTAIRYNQNYSQARLHANPSWCNDAENDLAGVGAFIGVDLGMETNITGITIQEGSNHQRVAWFMIVYGPDPAPYGVNTKRVTNRATGQQIFKGLENDEKEKLIELKPEEQFSAQYVMIIPTLALDPTDTQFPQTCMRFELHTSCPDDVLKCHKCTTVEHGDLCADEYMANDTFLGLCDVDHNVCMKLVSIGNSVPSDKHVYAEHARVISRFCGSIDESWNKCFGTEGASSYTTECYCRTDGCNIARHLAYTTITIVATVLTSLSMF